MFGLSLLDDAKSTIHELNQTKVFELGISGAFSLSSGS